MAAHHHLFKYLQQKKQRTNIDKLMSVAAVVYPFIGLPQVYQLYTVKDAAGLSIWTWLIWLVLGLVFVSYGIAHKLKPYITMQVLWIFLCIAMIIGILIYG